MASSDIDWNAIQNDFESNIISQICKFSGNEFSACNVELPNFFNLKETIEAQKNAFINQFTEYVPVYNPHFFSDKIRSDFEKTYTIDNYSNFDDFFRNLIKSVQWKNEKVFNRMNSENTYPKYTKEMERFLKSTSKFMKTCELGICNLNTPDADPKFVEIAIRYDMLNYHRNFALQNIYDLFKQFPLVRRHEILKIAANRFIEDTEAEMNAKSLPSVIKDTEVLREELKRLAGIMNIEFDLESHDGQHFSYLCEKLYGKCVTMTVDCEKIYSDIKLVEDPTLLDRLNYNFMNSIKIDVAVKICFDSLINPDPKNLNSSLAKFSNQTVKDLTSDKVTTLVRLQFSRNKLLLHSIIDSLKAIDKLKQELFKTEQNEYFNEQFPIFTKQILVASTAMKSNAKDIEIDNESLLELLLEIFDNFYKQKVLIMNSLIEVKRNTQKVEIESIAKQILQLRPNFLTGVHNSCLTPFRLSNDILHKIADVIQTLINYQIYNNNMFGELNKDLFPWFEFPSNTDSSPDNCNQASNEQFPYSIISIYSCLQKIPDFLKVSYDITNEIITSFSVRDLKFQSYFYFAVWSQLLNDTSNMLTNSNPESYAFNMKMSNVVSQTMSSPILNDLYYIHDKIYEQEPEKRYKFALKLYQMIKLTQKLRNYLIRSDNLLAVYQKQVQTRSKGDIKDVIDFAYGNYDFSSITDEWMPDELLTIIQAQHNFFLTASIAVRYNNFGDDNTFIQEFFEMNAHGNGFTSRPTRAMIQHQQVLRNAPNLLFYEPKIIKESDFSAQFCNLSDAKDFTATDQIIVSFIHYCYLSEIAFLSIFERNFLLHYTSQDAFILFPNEEVSNILDENDHLEHFFVPTIVQVLSLKNPTNILQQLLKFILIRVQLLELIRHESYVTQSKPKIMENIYNETLLFASPFFSRLSVEIKRTQNPSDITLSIEYFDIERITYCNKIYLTALALYENVMIPKEPVYYSLESTKLYIQSMFEPLFGKHSFMTPGLYFQRYLNQFWYQCNDQFRAEFMSMQSQLEQKIDDSIVGFNNSDYRINAYNFSLNLLRLSFLKIGYYWLLVCNDPFKVTIESSIVNLTNETFTKGKAAYDANVNIKSTTRIGQRPQTGTIETALLAERTIVLIEVVHELLNNLYKTIYEAQFKAKSEEIEEVFSAPNQMLKPDCYAKRIQINNSHNNYLPTISSIKEQFLQEVSYARSRFCHAVARMVTVYKKDDPMDQNMVTLKLDELNQDLNTISEMLTGFVVVSEARLTLTWSGYLANVLKEFHVRLNEQEYLNMYIKDFLLKYRGAIAFNLATKLQKNYQTLAHLRDEEKVVNQEQDRFEKRITREIRAEFDLLVKDLKEEIQKAKMKFIQSKNFIYESAYDAINRFKDNPTFINNVTNKEIADKIVNEPIEIRDPVRRKIARQLQIIDPKPPKEKKDIHDKIEDTKKEIEELQILKKKLRISTTLSCIGFSKIYSRMINKVAEEKKGFSMTLWHGQRLLEEDMEELNSELQGAYHQLTNTEIEIENLRQEIEESKKKNAKLLHWKEMNLRAADRVHNEMKQLTKDNSNDVNVTQLLRQIQEKSDELEMLDFETQQLEQQIEYEVREPMAQLDYMRRALTRRRAARVQFPGQENSQQYYFQQSSATQPSSPRSQSSRRSSQQNSQQNSQQGSQQNSRPGSVSQENEEIVEVEEHKLTNHSGHLPVTQEGMQKLNELLQENEEIKKENESIRQQIAELEAKIAAMPPSTVPLLTELIGVNDPSARPRSTRQSKKIVRPGVGRSFTGSSRPLTSRI
ncbi:hypothetical protein TRFO_12224 [Tritrichomonas foetus]|uniref:Uncharacterized protein n=1 Tax=Tritrichomonas foetus TaxID=1144522 RepID=A0A1J4J5Y0_9EUKA|nr:hypothetical protein TRFO_12224 [Tritrichomonas foetus]|eukprot:OHS92861.1 hypothetical protein TRFO_12224 [Tritrichomonas foetus]